MLKRVLMSACFAMSLTATEPPIGKEQASGNIRILTVESTEDFTVFVKSRDCDSIGVEVTIVFSSAEPGEKLRVTQMVRFRDCNLSTQKLSFPTDGRVVREVRVNEVMGRSSQTVYP
jgi:hypothetical protein